MRVFVDTSALYALMDRDDRYHQAARETFESLLGSDETLVLSSYVFIEACALVQRRLGMPALHAFCEAVVPALELHWVTPEEHLHATAAVLTANQRELSFVDCVSFQVMRAGLLTDVFAFDPHFAEQGFRLRPA